MPYVNSYYYENGDLNRCRTINAWRCCGGGDFNDPVRNEITSAYFTAFGRYGEQAGVENYVSVWVYGSGKDTYSSIYDMVRSNAAGNDIAARNGARHTWGGAGSCPVRGCTDPNANNYNSSATLDDGSCTYSPPSVSLSASPTTIIRGASITLSWSASGVGLYSATLTDVSSPGYSGSATLSPANTKTYSYTVCGGGGCSTAQRTITVYIPPVITLSLNKSSIIAGECAQLSWSTTGDGDTIYWTAGNITNGNVTSSENVCPADTTTYCAYVTGLGGTSPTSCATLTVYQIPTIEKFEVPVDLIYGNQGFIEYEAKYANVSVEIQKIYNYNNGSVSQGSTSYPTSGTAELGGQNATVSNTVSTDITYDDFGPRSVTYVLTVLGNGGQVTQSKTVEILIDETPDNLNIEETDERIKDEDPVFTPNTPPGEIILSDLYYIDGIDIPIEIKSNYPIEVEVNDDGVWQKVREI